MSERERASERCALADDALRCAIGDLISRSRLHTTVSQFRRGPPALTTVSKDGSKQASNAPLGQHKF